MNTISKFNFQPFDVCVFLKQSTPLLLECKFSGVKKLKNKSLILSPSSRRYDGYFQNLDKIEQGILRCDIPLFFVYGDQDGAYVVSHLFIRKNLPNLLKRRVVLSDLDYIYINKETKNVLDSLIKLYEFSKKQQ